MLKGKKITFIESSFEEDVLLEAETLLEENALTGSLNAKTGHWELTVQDASYHFHTNIHLRGERIDEVSCNCNTYHQKEICRHVASALLFVRSRHESDVEAGSVKGEKVRSQSFKSFLTQIEYQDLAEFVRDHARTDQWFKLKFQARFYEKKNSVEKERFIESLFPVITKNHAKVPARKIGVFVKISVELLDHFNAYVQQNNLLEAFRLIFLLLKKSFYIKYHFSQANDRFIDNHELLLKNFHETLSLIEAPEFKISALNDLLHLISSSYITLHSRQEKNLWISLLNSTENKNSLSQVNQQFLSPPIKDYTTYYFMLSSELLILEGEKRDQAIRALTNQEIYRVIHTLTDYLDLAPAVDALKRIFLIYSLNYPLATHVLKHLGTESVDEELIDRVIYFLDRFHKRFFIQWLADYSSLSYLDVLRKLNPGLLERSKDLQLDLLCAFGMYEEAADVLETSSSPDTIRRFDSELAVHVPDRIAEIYLQHAKLYLSEHFGIHARQYVNHLLGHLRELLDPLHSREVESKLRNLLSRRKVRQ